MHACIWRRARAYGDARVHMATRRDTVCVCSDLGPFDFECAMSVLSARSCVMRSAA